MKLEYTSHIMTENPTALCWEEKYLLWFRETLAHGKIRNKAPLNEPVHKPKNQLHLTRDRDRQPQLPNKKETPSVSSVGRWLGLAGLISDTCSPSWGALLVVSSSKAKDGKHNSKKNQTYGQMGLMA